MKNVVIRDGSPTDIQDLYSLIRALAIFEKAEHELVITPEQLLEDGFGESPKFRFIVAMNGEVCLGTALFYEKYSTWTGRCFYLEDLIVSEKHRGQGIGKKLLDRLIEITKNESKARLEWQVLDWNTPAIDFYKKYKAELDDTWINVRLRF